MGAMVAIGVATAISVTTVLESVAVVGAVLSVVGTVTKNKTLSMIGMGLGLVGGVGALASGALGGSAALFGEASSAGGEAAAGAAGDAAAATAADGAAAGTFGPGFGDGIISAAAPDAIGALSGAPAIDAAVDPGVALSGASDASAGASDTFSLASQSTNAADAVAPGTTGAADAGAGAGAADTTAADLIQPPAAPPNNLGAVNPATGETITSAVDSTGKVVSLPGDSSGVFGQLGKIVDYAGAHPVVALGALQAGGSLLSGMTSTLTPAQVDALNAQAAANNAATALSNQQRTNLSMPKSVASSAPVTGTPSPLVPGQAGFINSAPRAVQVPGAAAA